jgi:hypothetical protein
MRLIALVFAASMTIPAHDSLLRSLGFDHKQLQSLASGQAVSRLFPADDRSMINMGGAVIVNATPQHYVERFREAARFQEGNSVMGAGRFSAVPRIEDLNAVTIPEDDIDDLLSCEPGDCDFALTRDALERLKRQIDRRKPDHRAQVARFVKSEFITQINAYRRDGNKGLAVYHDKEEPFSTAASLHRLSDTSNVLKFISPEVDRYLDEYPNNRPPGTEDYFAWQFAKFGMKPVIRASHVVIRKFPYGSRTGYVIAGKTLLATHYFRSALELTVLYPQPDGRTTVVMTQRSVIDGFNTWRGRLLRGFIMDRSQKSLQNYLSGIPARM